MNFELAFTERHNRNNCEIRYSHFPSQIASEVAGRLVLTQNFFIMRNPEVLTNSTMALARFNK